MPFEAVLISTAVFILAGAAARAAGGSFLSPIGLFYLYNAVMIFPGVIFLCLAASIPGFEQVIVLENISTNPSTAVIYSFSVLFISLGALFANLFWGVRGRTELKVPGRPHRGAKRQRQIRDREPFLRGLAGRTGRLLRRCRGAGP